MTFNHAYYTQFVELIGFAGAIACLYGQTQKVDRILKLYMAVGFAFWTVHYALIGGASGIAAVFGVASLRQAVLVFWHPRGHRERIVFASGCIALAFVVGLHWWSGLSTVIALFGLCWSSYAFTYLTGISLRFGLIINNLIWLAGAVVAVSYTGMFYQALATLLVGWSIVVMRRLEVQKAEYAVTLEALEVETGN